MDTDKWMRAFFGGNAFMAVVILVFIIVFLFFEGFRFFPQHRENLKEFRQTGKEWAVMIEAQYQGFLDLAQRANAVRSVKLADAYDAFEADPANAPLLEGLSRRAKEDRIWMEVTNQLQGQSLWIDSFFLAGQPLLDLKLDLEKQALDIAKGWSPDMTQEELEPVLVRAEDLQQSLDRVRAVQAEFQRVLPLIIDRGDSSEREAFAPLIADLRTQTQAYFYTFAGSIEQMEQWTPRKPVPLLKELTSFLFGSQWITSSAFHDFYGVIPLFTGSLLISIIALTLAIPFGVGMAIYVNQIAGPKEREAIKPCIEFIQAIPSVVLGFFGVVVLGELLRDVSQLAFLQWIPFFPMAERLNALTAGCLLALMAVPTIFSLSEDALNNVPRAFKEASFAMGANRLQTIARIIVPTAISGIISAILLGFGRVIGETMVVLLCAGNRIAIPDFTQGLGVVTVPVHTMTGIIAQELGEVVPGSIHYRSLFCVGIVLFFITLAINSLAQAIVRRYRIAA